MPEDPLPFATVAIPARNEAATIEACLRATIAQDYPDDRYEIVVVDGASVDDTRARVEGVARTSPVPVTLLDNPQRSVPAALNRALAHATGAYLVRVDGHSEPAPAYLRACVQAAEELDAGLAGGWVEAVGRTAVGRAVAAAVASPFATGNAGSWRRPAAPREVVSVPCGAYRLDALRAIGGFDEGQLANQDYEANLRLRDAGWKVFILPDVHFDYVTRSTLRALARQFARYGWFRARTMSKHPHSARPRHLLPPAAVLVALVLVVLAAIVPYAWIALAAAAALYAAALVAASFATGRGIGRAALVLPVVFATIHASWGSGALAGLVRWWPIRRRLRTPDGLM